MPPVRNRTAQEIDRTHPRTVVGHAPDSWQRSSSAQAACSATTHHTFEPAVPVPPHAAQNVGQILARVLETIDEQRKPLSVTREHNTRGEQPAAKRGRRRMTSLRQSPSPSTMSHQFEDTYSGIVVLQQITLNCLMNPFLEWPARSSLRKTCTTSH